jgi:hypothetical protein
VLLVLLGFHPQELPFICSPSFVSLLVVLWLVCVAGVALGSSPAVAPCGSVHLFTFFRVVVAAVRFVRRFFDEITMRLVTLRRPCGGKLFFRK